MYQFYPINCDDVSKLAVIGEAKPRAIHFRPARTVHQFCSINGDGMSKLAAVGGLQATPRATHRRPARIMCQF